MIIIKGDAFKKIIITQNGCCKTYIYNTFDDFIKILKDNYYNEIMSYREFYN